MKKLIIYLLVSSLTGLPLTACTTKFGRPDPEQKQALRTLAGGVLGALATQNVGGAIVGAFVVDIYNLSSIKYEDKKIENSEEAARKYKYKEEEKLGEKKEEKEKLGKKKEEEKKVGEKKKEEEKIGKIKEEEKKIGEKPIEEKKIGEKKKEEEKVGEKKEEKERIGERKEEEKKVGEKKKEEERVRLFIEDSAVVTQPVKAGSSVEAKVQYTLLAPGDNEQITITETRVLSSANKLMELDKREVVRTQGTYVSTIKFTMPEDIPRGYCILFTVISVEKYARTARSVMNII